MTKGVCLGVEKCVISCFIVESPIVTTILYLALDLGSCIYIHTTSVNIRNKTTNNYTYFEQPYLKWSWRTGLVIKHILNLRMYTKQTPHLDTTSKNYAESKFLLVEVLKSFLPHRSMLIMEMCPE